MISSQSIEDKRRSAMMNGITSTSPSFPTSQQAASPYSDRAVSPYSDTVENDNGGGEPNSRTKTIRFFDIDTALVEEDCADHTVPVHDQLPSTEEVKANVHFDLSAQKKKRSSRYNNILLVLGIAILVVFALVIHNKGIRDRYQSAVASVTTTVLLSHQDAFLDPKSPQSKALLWMINEDSLRLPLPSSKSDPFVQRYAIAVLVFALTKPNTKTSMSLSEENTRTIFGLLSGVHECEWKSEWEKFEDKKEDRVEMGILCDQESVIGIFFPRSGLQGELPPELELLSNLRRTNLANNQITGTIPSMPHLRNLNLSYNQLTGNLPGHVSKMIYLTSLRLSNNALKGSLPDKFGSLTNLQVLDLNENQLNGRLEELYSLNNIEELYLAYNSFDEQLTQNSFRELSNLRVIDAKENRISGSIPNALWRLTNLEVIDFHKNSLDGHIVNSNNIIPENHPLKYLDISNNLLDGGIPTSIGNLGSLTHLNFSYNRLDSRIPRDHMASMTNLKTLLVTEDDGMGFEPLPDWLKGMTGLQHLSFRLATRTGTIPTWFGELTKLELLDLDWNHISGTIPTELGLLTNLKYLMLNRNLLSGTVPTEVTYLPKLKILMLDTNDLVDTILVGDEEACDAATTNGSDKSLGRIEHLIADCGKTQEKQETLEQEVECPCCTSCCWDSAPRCNMQDWTQLQIVEEEYRGTYDRKEYSDYASFVPMA